MIARLKIATRMIAALVIPQMLVGCVVPPLATAISMSLDGASLMASDKTLTDHAVSGLTQRDCALSRTATGGIWCMDPRTRKPNWHEIQAVILLRAKYGLGETEVEHANDGDTMARRVEFGTDPWGRRIAWLEGFPASTSLFGIIGERGVLEVYAYEYRGKATPGPIRRQGLTLIFTVPGYADWPNLFAGVVLHGTLHAMKDIIV